MWPKQHVFCLCLIFLHELTSLVNGLPLSNSTRNIARPSNSTRNITRPSNQVRSTKPPGNRKARLFGKLSLIAGVGLPEVNQDKASERNDLLPYETQRPLVATYNFPPARWGPYFAAVYEPALALFLRNPLGFIANLLNPYNWFAGSTSAGVTESSISLTGATDARPDSNVVVVVHETSEPDERGMPTDKLEMKMETTGVPTKGETTILNGNDFFTTINTGETEANEIKDSADDTRQARPTQTKRPATKATTKPTTATTKPTSNTPETTVTTSQSGGTNVTQPTGYPFYPYPFNGYYGGYPQNVSNLEFTSPPTTNVFSASPDQNFEVNEFGQQFSSNFREPFNLQPNPVYYDYFGRSDLVPGSRDYYVGNEISSNNGFRPIDPYYNNI